MQYHDTKFVGSVGVNQLYPETVLPEIVFAGRSNAGKSSLINALLNRKNLAYVGKTPGKTRLLNFFAVDGKLMFADAPGYGYAEGGHSTAKQFGRLMEPYFNEREPLKAMVLVLDIRRVPNDDDIRMVEYAREAHLAVIAACTKCDKVSRSQAFSSRQKICSVLGIRPDSAVLTSSETKAGMEELWEKLLVFVPEGSE